MFKDELILIRHARSQHNVRATDELDCSLTEWGLNQAQVVADFMANHMNLEGFWFYSSPFLRCLQTSKAIYDRLKQPFRIDQRLHEYLNHSGKDVSVPHRGLQKEYNYPGFLWSDYPDEGVRFQTEFNEQLLNRTLSIYDDLQDRSVVVTHGLPLMVLIRIATSTDWSVPIWDHSIDNASITYIVKGRIVWLGRNLYTELDYDPFQHKRP